LRRALRIGAALGVAALIVYTFAPLRSERAELEPASVEPASADSPEVIRIAHIELEREPPPAPPKPTPRASRPRPRPPPPDPPVTKAEPPESDPLVRGRALLQAGAFPRLRASYARIGFERYRDAMVALGAGFYLFDADRRQPVAQLDPATGAIVPGAPRTELSRWPRDVTRHLKDALEDGRQRFGPSVSRVILLPPARVDAMLLGALDAHLGSAAADVVRVDLAYLLEGDRLGCEVLAVGLRDGSERAVNLKIDLEGGVVG
jgi:hypothetical protein